MANPPDDDPPVAALESGATLRSRLRRWLPWILTLAILWYLFRKVPAAQAWQAAREARLDIFLPVSLTTVVLWFFLESGAFAYLFSRFNAALTWTEARSLRGLTYLLTPINWNAGTAAIVLHLRRSKGIGALDSSSSMLFYTTIDGIVLGCLTLIGTRTLEPSPTIAGIARGAAVFVGIQALLLVALMVRQPEWPWLRRIRSLGLFRTYQMATGRDLAILVGIRSSYFAAYVLFFWLGANAFHVDVPLDFAMASTPIILLSAVLPITPGGLGTQQAAMLYLFAPYGAKAPILAFALAFPVAVMLTRMMLGLVYVRDLGTLRRDD